MKCERCNGEMWDNRANKASGKFKPKSPDFSCKNKEGCGHAVWLDHDEQKRSNGGQNSTVPKTSFQNAKQEMETPYVDTRQDQIMRQHSQEMALRFFALNGTVPSTTQLRDMTSWFQRDINHQPIKEELE